ncbi:hypothetical protein [Treponema sp. R80B11-R83G3]
MKCKYFDECSAAICPMDERAAQSVWFADEPVCRLQDVPEWVKRQRKIVRIGMETITGYFTLPMLERRCVIGKKMSGIDPDSTDEERETAEKNWLCGHPTVKAKTGVEREKMAERMRFLRSIRLGVEVEKHKSVQGKTSTEEKKVKSHSDNGQGCFTPSNLNNGGGIKK